jgi:hypothetical protein
VAELVCIGEYTNANGPSLDDYFLVFGLRNGLWYEGSFYSDGCDEIIEKIGKVLGCDLHFELIQPTIPCTRILWPKDMEGQPLLVDKTVNPGLKRFT